MSPKHPKSNLTRRSFLKATTIVAAAASPPKSQAVSFAAAGPEAKASVRVQDDRIHVETHTLKAMLEKGYLRSLKSKLTGDEFIQSFDLRSAPSLQLIYRGDEGAALDENKFGTISCRQVSDHRAEFNFQSWDGDGILSISVDPGSGDLLLDTHHLHAFIT